jgi:hypothetical protein
VTGLLHEFEKTGYRFRLDGEQVMVRGPQRLLDDEHVARLRDHKPEIKRKLALRDFVDLVRHTGAGDHRLLFSRGEIMAALDLDAAADLLTTTRKQRQASAASIAFRLVRARIDPSWLQDTA